MKKLRVAILGQGRSGRDIHARYLSTDTRRFTVAAVVDPLADRRARAEKEFGCEAYASHKALLKRDDIDLVVNATPSKFHVPYTLEFLRAGFNVLVDKPFAPRVRDADRMIEAAKKAGVTLAVFQQSRFAPYYRQVKKVVDSGVLGEIIQVNIAFNGFGRRYDWQTLTSESAGSLLNTGPHPLDQALQFMGTDAKLSVNCWMRNAKSLGDADDHILLVLSAPDRPIVHVEVSSCCKMPTDTYRVYGTHGGLHGGMTQMEWSYYNPAKAPRLKLITEPLSHPDGTPAYCSDPVTFTTKTWTVPEKQKNLFQTISSGYYTMLHKALTEGKPMEVTLEQVRQQVWVIEQCHKQNPHIWGAKKARKK